MVNDNVISAVVRQALNKFIVESDNRTAFRYLLNELIQITESEYGFIGEVHRDADDQPYLQIHAYTNIAWDDATRMLLAQNQESGLRFDNLQTLFGAVMTTGEVVISNQPSTDVRSGGLPPGHPDLNAFLGCPLRFGDQITGVVGLANRPEGYSQATVQVLEPVLAACGMMLYARVSDLQRETLRRRDEDARRLESLIKLAGNLAHDLNNWLMVIMSTVEAVRLQNQPVSPPTLDVIFEAVQQASRLSLRMLEFSGMTATKKTVLAIGDLACHTMNALRSLAPPSIKIEFQCEDSGLMVSGDQTALSQAFTNIIKNAFEAMGDAGDSLLQITVKKSPQRTVTIEIQDNGPGITEQKMAHILEPYFSTRGPGRGFGLATVDGIVRAHQGRLEITSELNKGTRFSIVLPITDEPVEIEVQEPQTDLPSGPKRALMVVDDDPLVLSTVSQLLAVAGFEVISANSGQKAVEIAEQMLLCGALIDVAMPEMDGLETMTAIRKTKPNLPILLMSGFTPSAVPQHLLSEEFTDFLRKPFALGSALAALDRIGCTQNTN